MKKIYNDNLTIETRDDPNKRNLSECRALQEVVEGKALIIGGGIVPINQDAPLHDGVSLYIAEDPTGMAETKVDIVPDMMDGYPIIKIHSVPCEFDAPEDNHDQTDPTIPESLPDYAEVQDGADAIRDNLDELVLFWAEDAENGVDLFFGEARDRKADRQLCIRPYLDENGKPQVRFVCYFNYMKKDKPQQ